MRYNSISSKTLNGSVRDVGVAILYMFYNIVSSKTLNGSVGDVGLANLVYDITA